MKHSLYSGFKRVWPVLVICAIFLFPLPLNRVFANENTVDHSTPNPDSIVCLAAGKLHSAMILYDGSLYVWGDNTYGQLGLSDIDYADYPQPVDLPYKAVSVSLGSDHTLVLTETGLVYAMGRNTFGQLGIGSTESKDQPTLIETLPPVTAIAAGAWHSLALGDDGRVWGWGDNSSYQLGDIPSEKIIDSTGSVIGLRQVRPAVVVRQGASHIAAGGSFSLYINDDRQLFAWGDNTHGQLGDGTTQARSVPTHITSLSDVTQISAGYQHVLAVAGNPSRLYAWGDNGAGQLGLSGLPSGDAILSIPDVVDLPNDVHAHIALISAGYAHSAVVSWLPENEEVPRQSRQQIYTWGDASFGQLAREQGVHETGPRAIGGTFDGYSGSDFLPFEAIASGGFHFLIMSSKGLLAASGRGDRGQLGNRSIANRFVLTPIEIPDQIKPGWYPESSVYLSRSDDKITIRWPAAQDNRAVTGYTLLLRFSDGQISRVYTELDQEWVVPDEKPQAALEIAVYAHDSAHEKTPLRSLSHLVGFLPPSEDPEAAYDDYFASPRESVWLIEHDIHQWRPTPSGLIQPLEVPWSVTSIYGKNAIKEPPDNHFLMLAGFLAGLLLIVFLAYLVIKRIRDMSIQPAQKLPVKIQRVE